ncbi:MAG: aspartate-semialdehyde dehydrogenase [Eubacteriales bacterium]|nr:aspartate-semialdehyde dehydrogenase [Eubacteriales bacterium]
MKTTKIAVVGVTGLVGQMMLKVLQERHINGEYFLFASANHAGEKITMNGEEYIVEVLTPERVAEIKADFALFAAGAEVAREWAPRFVATGTTVIDNSSYYRMQPDVPLVVPEINLFSIQQYKLIANPNCSTIGAVVALAPLDRVYHIKRIVYATYQAISGAGKNPHFKHPITNNVLPDIDVRMPDGNTKEENKMINETRKILGRAEIAISATAARVPVANCHCVAINVEFAQQPDLARVKTILSQAAGVVYCDDYAVPTQVSGHDEVYVGRVRLDASQPNTLNLWTVSDNLRKGAATNAVQIMESLLA